MSLRVANILDAKRPTRSGLWKPVLGVSAALLALLFGAAPYAPQVVAFQPQSSSHQTGQAPQTQRAAGNQAISNPIALARNHTETKIAGLRAVAPQPRAIQAAFHPRSLAVPIRLKKIPLPAPTIMRAQALQEDLGMPTAFVILQTTRFDASGSGIMTFCVWKVGATNLAERQWESTIVVSMI
jgi:hypothetical protein